MFHFAHNNNDFFVTVKKGVINPSETQLDFKPSDFQEKIFMELNSAINNNAFDLDTDESDGGDPIPSIDCKYYNIEDFSSSNFNTRKSFSIFHFNIH